VLQGDAKLLSLADQCVKCGLCLPHCPTYRIGQEEGDSPRGRIALIEGWVRGDLATTPRLDAHLDQCLGCRACELACPSLVAFGRLMDTARARRVASLPRWRRWLRRARLKTLGSQRLLARGAVLATRYRHSRVGQRLEALGAHRVPGLGPIARLALTLTPPPAAPRADSHENAVNLFVGCTGAVTPGCGSAAAIRVLGALGISAHMPATPVCCGALYRHQGFPADAQREAERLVATLGDRPVVGLASACVAEWRGQGMRGEILELCAFLDQLAWPEHLRLAPIPQRVIVHEPCTHRLLPDGNRAVHRLLQRLPEIELGALPGDHCCGAAGTYMLDQPALAQALLRDKLESLRRLAPAILVTTNPGCSLHIAAGIREAGLPIEVCHPVALIDRQLYRDAVP